MACLYPVHLECATSKVEAGSGEWATVPGSMRFMHCCGIFRIDYGKPEKQEKSKSVNSNRDVSVTHGDWLVVTFLLQLGYDACIQHRIIRGLQSHEFRQH